MKKILFVVGPTAIGKTKFALNQASKINGELINADSIQVYKDLNIISGKDLPINAAIKKSTLSSKNFDLDYCLFKKTPVHLLDVIKNDYSFNVYDYANLSRIVMEGIWSRNSTPVVVGGNGYYIDSFFQDIPSINIPPDLILRKSLESKTKEELQSILQKKNIERFFLMNNSDRNNKRRLVRAIEVLYSKNKNPEINKIRLESLIVGLKTSKERIKQLIEKRVEERIKKGALVEAKTLFENYEKLSPQVKKASGYKELFAVLQGEFSLEEGIKNWKKSDINYAKKQMTWFGRNKNVIWADVDSIGEIKKLESKIYEWYNRI